MPKKTSLSFFALLLTLQMFAQQASQISPTGLLCDLVSTGANDLPLIYNKVPAFSWEFRGGSKQIAYQILLSDHLEKLNKGIGNIWDSGKLYRPVSTEVKFKGSVLKPNTRYYWKVKVWNFKNEASGYSKPETFLTADALSDYKNPSYPVELTAEQPVSWKAAGNIYHADFGRDAFGQIKIELNSENGGDTVMLRIGEILDANGNINRKPTGTIRYAQYVIALRKGKHIYKPEIYKDGFNTKPAAIKMPAAIGEVTPFRYCEIEGYNKPLAKTALTRLTAHYRFEEGKSSFHSSDSTLNAIWDLCKYSIKATSFLGIYVDGDRERIPYEADAYINQLSHYAVDKEFTLARNSHEYLITHPTWPTEWNLQSVLMGWNDYLYTGDMRSVSHYYKDLQAKTLVGLSDSTGLISTLNGRLTDSVKLSIHRGTGALKDIVDWPLNTETDGFVFTKYNAVVNAFHYRALVIMEKIAKDLGKAADAEMYHQKAADVRLTFQKNFFDRKRNVFVDGIGTDHASLHANAFALAFGLVDEKDQPGVMEFIRSRGMACSVYGAQFLLDGIYDARDAGYGLSLLTSKTDRSWYNMIRVGSTITLEAWDNKYKPNQDWNHAWGAAPANIISRKLMGIEPTSPGWSTFSIRPQIGILSYASITVPTIKGGIKVSYVQGATAFDMTVDIPANAIPEIYLPLKVAKAYSVMLDGKVIETIEAGQFVLVKNMGSGKHELKITYKNN